MALVEGPGLPGGSRRWPRALGRAPRLASVLLAREEDDRGGSSGGLGRQLELGQVAEVSARYGSFSLWFFISILLLFFYFAGLF